MRVLAFLPWRTVIRTVPVTSTAEPTFTTTVALPERPRGRATTFVADDAFVTATATVSSEPALAASPP